MADMPGMSDHAPAHEAERGDGCESADRERECPLMIACAPALLPGISAGASAVATTDSIIEWRTGTLIDARSKPEPPPPRA